MALMCHGWSRWGTILMYHEQSQWDFASVTGGGETDHETCANRRWWEEGDLQRKGTAGNISGRLNLMLVSQNT